MSEPLTSHKCLFCNEVFNINDDTFRTRQVFWEEDHTIAGTTLTPSDRLDLELFRCPGCSMISINISGGYGGQFQGYSKRIIPGSRVPRLSGVLPQSAYLDYEEACLIVSGSPKASATMSRRCLQGMIRDFWGISKSNLHQEIVALRGKIDDEIVDALLDMKSIANVGAHPNWDNSLDLLIDVDLDEAEALINMIEYITDDWYVAREKKKGLFAHLRKSREDRDVKNSTSSIDRASN